MNSFSLSRILSKCFLEKIILLLASRSLRQKSSLANGQKRDWNGILMNSWILISSTDHECSGATMLFSRNCWMPMWGSRIHSGRSAARTSNRYFCARIAKKRNVLDKIQYRKKVGEIIFEIGPAGLFSLTNALHYCEQNKTGSIKVLFLLNSCLVLVILLIGF